MITVRYSYTCKYERGGVALWHLMYGHIPIILTSTQNVDNVILNQEIYVAFGHTLWFRVIKTTGDIMIYCPQLFRMRSGPNQ